MPDNKRGNNNGFLSQDVIDFVESIGRIFDTFLSIFIYSHVEEKITITL